MGVIGSIGLSALFLALAIFVLFSYIFYLVIKNAVKYGVFEAKIKYLDYIDECKARSKQDKYNSEE